MKKLLRYLIFILLIILVLAVVLMYFSPKTLEFEETVVIEAPTNKIYNIVNDITEWNSWTTFSELDVEAKNSYTKKTEGVGAQWDWDGNDKVGKGSLKIIESVKDAKVVSQYDFNNMKTNPVNQMIFANDNGKTKVNWSFNGGETSFFMRPFNFIRKKGLQNTYAASLKNLKKIVEQRNKDNFYNGYKISETEIEDKYYLMNRQEVDIDKIQQYYTQNLTALFIKTNSAQVEMDGMPSGLYFSWDESRGVTDMAAAIPTKVALSVDGAISQLIPGGRAVQVDYYGDYDKTKPAHDAISSYMKDNNLFVNYPIVHEYLTDPTVEKNSEKWLTKISYYVSGQN